MEDAFFQDQTSEKIDNIKHNNASMLVCLRLRPLTLKQMAVNPIECIRAVDSKMVTFADYDDNQKRRNRQSQFAFDYVFDKEATTKNIYDQSLTVFLGGVLEGYNSTILAYGATGCGKTFTMVGQGSNQGLSALFLIDLLGRAQNLKITHHVALKLSYIEIYNQIIKDLLTSEDRTLQIREDPREGVYAQGATQIQVNSLVELATLLKVGAANRSKQSTGSNEASSRSHALLMVKVETRQKARGIKEEVSVGKLSLVDLAGSERATGSKGRQTEGGKINKSLLTLGNCIQILADGTRTHIPYRQSKLTRLLKQALGGNSRTAMLACLSPFVGTRQQSYNTLLYASRARNIGNSISRNVFNSQAHLSNYVSLIGNLKRENQELKKQLKSNKQYSLPHLKQSSTPIQLEADRLSNKIDAHFAKEANIIRTIHEINLKIDKSAFRLMKIQMQFKKGKQKKTKISKLQKQQDSLKTTIEDLVENRQKMQQKLQQIILFRGNIVQQIKNGEWGPNQTSSLFTHYRQKKIETQLEEIRLRQQRITNEQIEKDEMISLIGEQIKMRDKIIEEQRIIIQKNNIVNRITYSRLNQSQFLPSLHSSYDLSKSTLPRDLSSDQQYNQFIPKKQQNTRVIKKSPIKRGYNRIQSNNNSQISQDKRKELNHVSPKLSRKKKQNIVSSSTSKKKINFLDHVHLQR